MLLLRVSKPRMMKFGTGYFSNVDARPWRQIKPGKIVSEITEGDD
jgi:hypothetical protein